MRTRPLHRRFQAFAAWLLLACFFAAATGVLPTTGLIRSARLVAHGDRYACEAGHCGCVNARECWTKCCCMTMAQRLAWSIRNGVAIPSYARFTDEDARVARAIVAQQALAALKAGAAESCCEHPPKPNPASCCNSNAEATAPTSSPLLTPLACKGANTLSFVLLSPVPSNQDRASLTTPQVFVGSSIADDPAIASPDQDVPVPPPRMAA